MENAKFILFCVIDGILLILMIAIIIGITVGDHMRSVRRVTRADYNTKITKAKAKTDADFNATKNAAADEALAAKRAEELAALNKTLEEETEKALKDQEEAKKTMLAGATAALVIAPSTEKYTTDPQKHVDYYEETRMRAFSEKDDFMEKFTELTKDGVVFEKNKDRFV